MMTERAFTADEVQAAVRAVILYERERTDALLRRMNADAARRLREHRSGAPVEHMRALKDER